MTWRRAGLTSPYGTRIADGVVIRWFPLLRRKNRWAIWFVRYEKGQG